MIDCSPSIAGERENPNNQARCPAKSLSTHVESNALACVSSLAMLEIIEPFCANIPFSHFITGAPISYLLSASVCFSTELQFSIQACFASSPHSPFLHPIEFDISSLCLFLIISTAMRDIFRASSRPLCCFPSNSKP